MYIGSVKLSFSFIFYLFLSEIFFSYSVVKSFCGFKIIFMNFTLLVVVLITAIALVAIALGVARLISPRSYNGQKGEAYECGIPTRGKSWMQFKVGYYLFAILFLMFDVETVYLFPWAVIVKETGVDGLYCILFFMIVLILGLAYAWKKGALEWK